MIYNNYHKHDHYSNTRTPDVIVKPEDYISRLLELGHTHYFTTNHGCSGNVFEAYDLCKKNDLKMVYGMEMYYVDDRFEKNRKNFHIIVIGLTKNAYYHINRISSEANKTGFYYHPRVDRELLLSLPKDEVIITTACINNRIFGGENGIEEFLIPLKEHFNNNFLLEVQNHNHQIQIEWNKKILELSKKYSISIIHGNDSHYIYPEQSKDRVEFLKGKGMNYGDEDSFILDFPNYETILNRYKNQGVLNDEQIYQSLENTLIFDKAEDLNFTKEIKMPTIYPNLTPHERLLKLKDIIVDKWNKESKNIPINEHKKYKEAIKFEMKILKETNEVKTSDYFLINEKIIDIGVNKYDGILTRTGRGCFTEDALVHTKNTLKSIKDIKIGDEVITKDGKFNKVINTMAYDVNEKLIQIKHLYGTDKYYPTICTSDHKILINRNGKVEWIAAKNIIKSDFVCVPKIKSQSILPGYIDLNNYNIFGYEFDEKYIYEYSPYINNEYTYSPTEVSRTIGVGKSVFEKFANGDKNVLTNKKYWAREKFFELFPFNTQEDYVKYIKQKRTKKINRYIKLDKTFNQFIGLMYGDGFAPKNRPYTIGLAINNTTKKDEINRKIFFEIAYKFNIDVYENKSKIKKLSQLTINSNIISRFIRADLFISQQNKEKQFNNKWFNQDKNNLIGIIEGLRFSDGSFPQIDE